MTFKPANAMQTSLSAEANSSRDLGLVGLGFSVQYKGKPSRAVGSCLVQHTLKKLPFQPLKEFWKRVKRILPATLEKLTQRLFPYFYTSKKWRKTSTDGGMPRYPHKIWKALTKAQPFGCSWAGATLTSVSSSLS